MRWRVALMVVFALLAAACGGGSDEDESSIGDTTTEEDTAPAGGAQIVTSADGRLTVTPPDDAPEISVASVDTDLALPVGNTVLGAYELGPDGATFDIPVLLEFEVTPEQMASGVAVVLTSSDGSAESLPLEYDGTGTIAVAVPHFSTVTFIGDRLVEMSIGEVSTRATVITLPVGETAAVSFDADFADDSNDLLIAEPQSPASWSATPPVTGSAVAGVPFQYLATCGDEGDGEVKLEGMIRFDSSLPGPGGGPIDIADFANADLTVNVVCTAPSEPIEFTDERCTDWNTGDAREDCATPEVRLRQVTGEVLEMGLRTAAPDVEPGPDDTVNVTFAAQRDDGAVILDCRIVEGVGTCGWFNQFFLPGDLPPETSIELVDGLATIADLPIAAGPEGLVIEVPALTFLDGQGEPFEESEAFTAPLVDISVFTRSGDRLHTGFIDPVSVAPALTAP